jgi:hypothetical protein
MKNTKTIRSKPKPLRGRTGAKSDDNQETSKEFERGGWE